MSTRPRTLRFLDLIVFSLSLLCSSTPSSTSLILRSAYEDAVVTLVTNEDYIAGAVALGYSLRMSGTSLKRVAMVSQAVSEPMRKILVQKGGWDLVDVPDIPCNQVVSDRLNAFDVKLQDKRWTTTCTKFAVWSLVQFRRILYMDADTVVVGSIDDTLYGFTNASFAAAPETMPPDQFNAGVMVLTPSAETFEKLLQIHRTHGAQVEGGDQTLLNTLFCPTWYTSPPEDPSCARLPWIFNVNAMNYAVYASMRKSLNERPVAVIHFVGGTKPWHLLSLEYQGVAPDQALGAGASGGKPDPCGQKQFSEQYVVPYMLWRSMYLSAERDHTQEEKKKQKAEKRHKQLSSDALSEKPLIRRNVTPSPPDKLPSKMYGKSTRRRRSENAGLDSICTSGDGRKWSC